jgi:hypothetical protein
MPSRLLLSLAGFGLIAGPALAGPALAGPRPDPTDAAAPVPPLEHRSSLEEYRRFEPATPAPWRASNQAVGAPASPDRSVETAPAPPAKPATPGGHAGHKH